MKPDAAAPTWRRYLRFWGNDPTRDLDDELAFHLEARYDEYLAMGLDPAHARAEANRRFGDLTTFRDQCAAIDAQWERSRSMLELVHTLAADIRYAVRQLLRVPSLTIAAVLCFALGIGANTSIFSVVNAVLLRPLPFPNSDRLVLVGEELPAFGGGNFGTISPPEYLDYKTLDGRVFAASAVYDNASSVLAGDGEPERLRTAVASSALFDVLKVRAAVGRTFLADEDRVGGPNVAVLSDALWRRRFNGDSSIVGRPIMLDGTSFTVIGVLPRALVFPLPGMGDDNAELFTPYRMDAEVLRIRGDSYNARFIARLAPGVTFEQAGRAVADVASRLPQLHPDVYGPRHTTIGTLFTLRERTVGGVRRSLLVLLAVVGLVLLIACINVSSLLLARAVSRRREISVRRALGASRSRLIQQFLAESLVLVAAGSVLGSIIAVWGSRALALHAPNSLLQGYAVSVDGRVLLFTALLAIVTAVAVSLFPALQQPERMLATTLREEGRAGSGLSAQRGRRVLVTCEIALAVIVATGAALMVKSLVKARNANPGFNADKLLTFRVGLPDYRYRAPDEILQAEQGMLDRLRAIPGIANVTAATSAPMNGSWHIAISIEGTTLEKTPIALNTVVFPDYFATMQIPVRAGRALTGHETRDMARVAMVNETFARKFLRGTNPVGHRIKWGSPTSPSPYATIVGVTADVKVAAMDADPEPAVYFAAQQMDTGVVSRVMRDVAFIVRSNIEPTSMFNPVRAAVQSADRELPLINLRTFDEAMQLSVATRRFNTALLAGFALLALTLAAVGIYGLMSYAVVQRTREIGIRLAIGAQASDVLRLVVGQGARLAITGVVLGLLGALAVTRILATLLFDVSPLDPSAFAASALILLAIATLASYLPARRAARVDPQLAIRGD